MTHIGWILNLSNGMTILEQPQIPNQNSSWQQVLDYLDTLEGVKPTGITLNWNGIQVFAMPKADGYFQGSEAITHMRDMTNINILRGIGTILGDKVFITWIGENGQIFQNIRSLESCRLHTTLR